MRRRDWALIGADIALVLALVAAYAGPHWSVAGLTFGRARHAASAEAATEPDQPQSTDDAPPASTDEPPGVVSARVAGWVATENRAPGTDDWRITAHDTASAIEGYASATSVRPGGPLTVFASTASPSYVAQVFRMGFYGGKQGRLVWTSPSQRGGRQPAPAWDSASGLVAAHWSPSFTVPVGADWLPGAYLVKLTASGGDQSYVPFTVRDDAAVGGLLLVDAVTTWQAYNTWGGCSLYECPGRKGKKRAVKVSFDRPYARSFNDGSADFLDHELPLIALTEELGLDARYATSIDLHEHPELATGARAVVSLGHDEYYSRPMRQALADALAHGTNLAFFGANAIYRHIRLEPDRDGVADRTEVNYRNEKDPVTSDATHEWRLQGKPEASLVGIQYVCAGVDADLVVRDSAHWIWQGSGVHDGQALEGLVGNESDGVDPAASPPNLDLLATSPITCGQKAASGATAYHSVTSGAGVFASGTIWWVCALEARYCSTPENTAPVRAATANVLRTFAAGPAGAVHPSGPHTT